MDKSQFIGYRKGSLLCRHTSQAPSEGLERDGEGWRGWKTENLKLVSLNSP